MDDSPATSADSSPAKPSAKKTKASCPHCSKTLAFNEAAGQGKANTNYWRHVNKCKKKLDPQQPSIGTFFRAVRKPQQPQQPQQDPQRLDDEEEQAPRSPARAEQHPSDQPPPGNDTDTPTQPQLQPLPATGTPAAAVQQPAPTADGPPTRRACCGYRPNIPSPFTSNYPFALHAYLDLPWVADTTGALRATGCSRWARPDCSNCQVCADLADHEELRKIVDRAARPTVDHTNYRYRTHSQMEQTAKEYSEAKQQLATRLRSALRSLGVMGKTLSQHKRLLWTLARCDVPRLRQLIARELAQGRSLTHIMERVAEAISGAYSAQQFEQADFDIALLVLRLGGRTLLHAVSKRYHLPSIRTLMRQKRVRFKVSTRGYSRQDVRHNIEAMMGSKTQASAQQPAAPAAATPAQQPAAPAAATPAQKPATPAAATPAQQPAAPAAATPAQKPATPAAATPAQQAVAPTAATPAQKPATPAAATPAQQAVAPTAATPAQKPATPAAATPAQQAVAPTAATPAQKPATPAAATPAQQAATHAQPTSAKLRMIVVMMDEIALQAAMRYHAPSLCVVGGCWQHANNAPPMLVDSTDSVDKIKQALDSGQVHVAEEMTVCAVKVMGQDGAARPILALPHCKTSDHQKQVELIQALLDHWFDEFVDRYGRPVTFACDGAGVRRKANHELFETRRIDTASSLYAEVAQCVGLDQHAGKGEVTVNYDEKHIFKRLRERIKSRGSDNQPASIAVGPVRLNVATHDQFLSMTGMSDSRRQSLLDPRDAMNVTAAVELCVAIAGVEGLQNVPAQMVQQWQAEKLLGRICLCLHSIFDTALDLTEQLTQLSELAHLLAYLYEGTQNRGKFLPAVLYHDMQACVKNAFYVTMKFKLDCPGEKLYYFDCGDNPIEEFFALLRTASHQRNMDVVEFEDRVGILGQVMDALDRNEDWRSQHRRLQASRGDDRNRPRYVTGDRVVRPDMDIAKCWSDGCHRAIQRLTASRLFQQQLVTTWFSTLRARSVNSPSWSLLQPDGKAVGVLPRAQDPEWNAAPRVVQPLPLLSADTTNADLGADMDGAEDADVADLLQAVDTVDDGTGEDTVSNDKHWLEVDGQLMHKATLVRTTFGRGHSSNDRIYRVRESRWGRPTDTNNNACASSADDEDRIMQGDPVAVLVTVKDRRCLALMLVDTITLNKQPVFDISVTQLVSAHLAGRLLSLTVTASSVHSKGDGAGRINAAGSMVLPLSPEPPAPGTAGVTYTFTKDQLDGVFTIISDTSSGSVSVNPAAQRELPYKDAFGKEHFCDLPLGVDRGRSWTWQQAMVCPWQPLGMPRANSSLPFLAALSGRDAGP